MFKNTQRKLRQRRKDQLAPDSPSVGMRLIFRAEVMPSRETSERTFEVARVLAGGRVELINLQGEHAITEFEPLANC